MSNEYPNTTKGARCPDRWVGCDKRVHRFYSFSSMLPSKIQIWCKKLSMAFLSTFMITFNFKIWKSKIDYLCGTLLKKFTDENRTILLILSMLPKRFFDSKDGVKKCLLYSYQKLIAVQFKKSEN